MPAQVLNGPAVATHMYQALFGKAPSNALYTSYISQIGTTDGAAFAAALTSGFSTTSNAALSTMVLSNLGVTATTMPATAAVAATATTPAVAAVTSADAYTALESALTSMFTGYGVAARGQIILNMTNLLANLEGDKTFGTIATTYNNQTLSNFTYASNATNTVPAAVVAADPVTAGQTYTLTSSIDNFTGASGNDTFLGDNTSTGAPDQINGGAGTDTLKLYGTVTKSVISNIENIYLNAPGGNFDASTITGVTALEVDAETGSRTFTVTTGQAVTLSNLQTTAQTQTIAGNTPTSLALTVNKVGKLDGTVTQTVELSGTALTTVNLTGSTADSAIILTNTPAKVTTLNVAGDKAVAITSAVNSVKTVNAASNTGGVTFDESGKTADNQLTFTGGSGNDKVVFKAGYLTAGTSGDVLDGGAGTDTLTINDTAPVYTAINAAKNFEVLGLNTSGATVDVAQLTSINSFAVGSGNLTETFNNAKSTSTFAINNTASNTGTVTINNAVGETATKVTIDNQAGSAQTLAALAFSGVSTIELNSTGKVGGSNAITNITNADNSAITVKGSLDFSLAGLDATTTGSKVDASAFTGKFTVVGSGKNDVIIGGAGNDSIQAAVGSTVGQADTLTGGAGADTFKIVATGTNVLATDFATLLTESAGTTGVLKITDFVAGTDKIHLEIDNTAGTNVAGTSITLATAQTIATAADLTAVYAGITAIGISNAGTALSGAVVTVGAGTAAGTYLYINDGTAGVSNTADMLINITGISGTLSASDFLFA